VFVVLLGVLEKECTLYSRMKRMRKRKSFEIHFISPKITNRVLFQVYSLFLL